MAFNGNPPEKSRPKRTGLKIVIFVGLALAAAIFSISKFFDQFDNIMRGNFAYTEGVRLLSENGAAKAILGSPIEAGHILSGNVQLNNLDGIAVYALKVSGPKCAGTYYIRADKHLGSWDIYLLALESHCTEPPLVIRNTRNVLTLGEEA